MEQCSPRGPSPKTKEALWAAPFTLGAEHQLYANFYRAVVASHSSECAGSLSKPEIRILPPADVFLRVWGKTHKRAMWIYLEWQGFTLK